MNINIVSNFVKEIAARLIQDAVDTLDTGMLDKS